MLPLFSSGLSKQKTSVNCGFRFQRYLSMDMKHTKHCYLKHFFKKFYVNPSILSYMFIFKMQTLFSFSLLLGCSIYLPCSHPQSPFLKRKSLNFNEIQFIQFSLYLLLSLLFEGERFWVLWKYLSMPLSKIKVNT